MINQAKELAYRMHENQFDLAKQPYIEHVERVVFNLKNILKNVTKYHDQTDDIICAAWLHDVYEDYSDKISLEQIRQQFGDNVHEMVYVLSKNTIECDEKAYYDRLINHDMAMLIKLADLKDNLDYKRFKKNNLTDKQKQRLSKYVKHHEMLKQKLIDNGCLSELEDDYIQDVLKKISNKNCLKPN